MATRLVLLASALLAACTQGDTTEGGTVGGGEPCTAMDLVIFQHRVQAGPGDYSDGMATTALGDAAAVPLGSSVPLAADPTWSPDGTAVAFAGGDSAYAHELYRQDLACDSAGLAHLGSASALRLTTFTDDDITVLAPAWNPADATQIACGLYTFNDSTLSDEYWIVIVDSVTGDTIRELTPRAGGRAVSPAWSPDGAEIAFTDAEGLKIVPADGSAPPQLVVPGEAAQPSWSPAGNRIVYSFTSIGGAARLWVVDLDDVPPTPVRVTTESGAWADATPAWMSDSNRIVFARFFDDGSPARLYHCAADGDGTATELPSMASLDADDGAMRPQPSIQPGP